MEFIKAWDSSALYPVATNRRKLLVDVLLSLPDYAPDCVPNDNATSDRGLGAPHGGTSLSSRLPTDPIELYDVGPLLFVRMLASIKRCLASSEAVDLELRVLAYLLRRHAWSTYVASDRTWDALRLIVAVLTSRRKGSDVDKQPALELVKQILSDSELMSAFVQAGGLAAITEVVEYTTHDEITKISCAILYMLAILPNSARDVTLSVKRLLQSQRSFAKYCAVDLCKHLWSNKQRRVLCFMDDSSRTNGGGDSTKWLVESLPQLIRFLMNSPILYQFEAAEFVCDLLTVSVVRASILHSLGAMLLLRFVVGGSSLVRCTTWAFSDIGILASNYEPEEEGRGGINDRRVAQTAWTLLQRSMRAEPKSLAEVIRDAKARRKQNSGIWSEEDADQHPEMVALYILYRAYRNISACSCPTTTAPLLHSIIDTNIPRVMLFALLVSASKLGGIVEYRKLRRQLLQSGMCENIPCAWSERDDAVWRDIKGQCSIYLPVKERLMLDDEHYCKDGSIRFFLYSLLTLDGLIGVSDLIRSSIIDTLREFNLSYILSEIRQDDCIYGYNPAHLTVRSFFCALLRLAIEEAEESEARDIPMAPSPMASPQVAAPTRKKVVGTGYPVASPPSSKPNVMKEKENSDELFVRKRAVRLPLPVYHSASPPIRPAPSQTSIYDNRRSTRNIVLAAIEGLRKQLKGNTLVAQLKADLMRAVNSDSVDQQKSIENDKLDAAASRVRSTLVKLAKDKELHDSGLMSSVMRRKTDLIMKLAPVSVVVDKTGGNSSRILKGGVVNFHDLLNSAVSFTNDHNRLVRKKYFDNIKALGVKLDEAELMDDDEEQEEDEGSELGPGKSAMPTKDANDPGKRRAQIRDFMRRDAIKARNELKARLDLIRGVKARDKISGTEPEVGQRPDMLAVPSDHVDFDAPLDHCGTAQQQEQLSPRPPQDSNASIRSASTRPKSTHRKYKTAGSIHSEKAVRNYLFAERNHAITSTDILALDDHNADDIALLQAQVNNLFSILPGTALLQS